MSEPNHKTFSKALGQLVEEGKSFTEVVQGKTNITVSSKVVGAIQPVFQLPVQSIVDEKSTVVVVECKCSDRVSSSSNDVGDKQPVPVMPSLGSEFLPFDQVLAEIAKQSSLSKKIVSDFHYKGKGVCHANLAHVKGCKAHGGREKLINFLKKLQEELWSCIQLVSSSPCGCGLKVFGLLKSRAKVGVTQPNLYLHNKIGKAQPTVNGKALLKYKRRKGGPQMRNATLVGSQEA